MIGGRKLSPPPALSASLASLSCPLFANKSRRVSLFAEVAFAPSAVVATGEQATILKSCVLERWSAGQNQHHSTARYLIPHFNWTCARRPEREVCLPRWADSDDTTWFVALAIEQLALVTDNGSHRFSFRLG